MENTAIRVKKSIMGIIYHEYNLIKMTSEFDDPNTKVGVVIISTQGYEMANGSFIGMSTHSFLYYDNTYFTLSPHTPADWHVFDRGHYFFTSQQITDDQLAILERIIKTCEFGTFVKYQ